MAGSGRGVSPKLTQLVDLIDEHHDAFVYDWRARFGMCFADCQTGRVPWGETLALFRILKADPSSHVAAAIHGMQSPWSREAFLLADVYDLTLAVNWANKHKDPTPYPRPTDPPPAKWGNTGGRSPDECRAILAARGHFVDTVPVLTASPPRPYRDPRGRFARRPS